jgi:hypothetical protein
MRHTALLFGLLLGGMLSACNAAPGPASPAADSAAPTGSHAWGAVAIDAVQGGLGSARDQDSQAAANALAQSRCQAAGGTQCVLEASYHQACVAIVLGPNAHRVVTAPTAQAAEDKGMAACSAVDTNCAVYHSECSPTPPDPAS